MTHIYRIPHAISILIDRSRPQAVLRAVAIEGDVDADAKREMTEALQRAALELGITLYEIVWHKTPERKD